MSVLKVKQALVIDMTAKLALLIVNIHSAQLTVVPAWENTAMRMEMSWKAFGEDVLTVPVS